jgi:hypothetical protein
MAPGEFVIAIVTEPEAAALFLFCLGKAFDGAALDGDCRRGGRFGTRRKQAEPGGRPGLAGEDGAALWRLVRCTAPAV